MSFCLLGCSEVWLCSGMWLLLNQICEVLAGLYFSYSSFFYTPDFSTPPCSILQLLYIPYLLSTPLLTVSIRISPYHPHHHTSKLPVASSLLRIMCTFSELTQTWYPLLYVLWVWSQLVYDPCLVTNVWEISQVQVSWDLWFSYWGLSSSASSIFSLNQPRGQLLLFLVWHKYLQLTL